MSCKSEGGPETNVTREKDLEEGGHGKERTD